MLPHLDFYLKAKEIALNMRLKEFERRETKVLRAQAAETSKVVVIYLYKVAIVIVLILIRNTSIRL